MEASYLVYIIMDVVIAVACCLGNILVIWAVKMCNSMQQPTFCLIVSLAVADFLVGALVVPFGFLVSGEVNSSFYGCLFMSCMCIVLTQASVLSLLAIAIDRFLRVLIPLKYKRIVTQSRSWAVVGICWLTAGIVGLTPMFGWNIHETSSNSTSTNTQACVFLNVMSMSYMVYFNFFGCILPPLLIITALYGYIFIAIHKQLREGAVSGSESVSYYRKERSLAGSLALVVVLYAFCWFPLHLMHVASFFWLVPVPSGAIDVGTLLSHTNSAVNPVVYAFKIEKLRAAYKIIWRRFILCCVEKCPTKDTHTTENCITDISTAKSVTSSGPVRPA